MSEEVNTIARSIKPAPAVTGTIACLYLIYRLIGEHGDEDESSIKEKIFAALAVVMLFSIFLALPPIPQNESYHDFADQRVLCGCIPNYMDVISNAPFFFVGLLGLNALLPRPVLPEDVDAFFRSEMMGQEDLVVGSDAERKAWITFYVGILTVSFGSAYYHWYRTSKTLVWDRTCDSLTLARVFEREAACKEHLRDTHVRSFEQDYP